MATTQGCHPFSSWYGGKCSGSKSPWVNDISHHIKAKPNQDSRKLKANTKRVHLHCVSTNVVKMSWRNRSRLREIRDCRILQSPFLNTALRRIFRTPYRNRLLEFKMQLSDCYMYHKNILIYFSREKSKVNMFQLKNKFLVNIYFSSQHAI